MTNTLAPMGTASFFVFLVREISHGKNKKDIVDSGKKLQKKGRWKMGAGSLQD